MKYFPSYIKLYKDGILEQRTNEFLSILRNCTLCPHKCGADRAETKNGKCRSGLLPFVSSFHAHFGEESCLVGRHGSGTIFFTNCNLSCIFCQNYDISHLGHGKEISYEELSGMMLELQARGCHNINLVTPTHMVYAIFKALLLAIGGGLHVPLVYNSGGYDSVETLQLCDGVFDIYMPDFKYMDGGTSGRLSGAKNYPEIAMAAIQEMYRQVGDLQIDEMGIAKRGLLVRHLVLPENLAATDRVISFISGLSKNTYLNIMDQYHPEYRAREINSLKRRTTLQEYDEAVELAITSGLKRLDKLK